MMKAAADAGKVCSALQEAARARFGERASIDSALADPLGRRTVRYTMDVLDPRRELVRWNLVGKVYQDDAAGQRGWESMRRITGGGFARLKPQWVRVPKCHGYFPQWCLLLMEEAPGQPLKELVKRRLAGPVHMKLFAEALAKVHRLPVDARRPVTVEDHVRERCDDLPDSLGRAFPELGGDIDRVLAAARRRENAVACTFAHNDYHFGQVHVAGPTAWILDFDRLDLGDPAYDLAMVFLVFKRMEQKDSRAEYIRSLRDAFLSAYFAQMDWPVAQRIPLHEALIHLKRACKRFKWQDEDGWQETVRIQVRQSAACVNVLERAAPPRRLADIVELYDLCPGAV
jgi:phosphotransferase family enzyme